MSCIYCTARPRPVLEADASAALVEMRAAGEAERRWLDCLLAGDVEREYGYRELRRVIVAGELARRRHNRAMRALESEARTA